MRQRCVSNAVEMEVWLCPSLHLPNYSEIEARMCADERVCTIIAVYSTSRIVLDAYRTAVCQFPIPCKHTFTAPKKKLSHNN